MLPTRPPENKDNNARAVDCAADVFICLAHSSCASFDCVHVISKKAARLFWEKHPDSETALRSWLKAMRDTEFKNLAELRSAFNSADNVGDLIVFNIGGNKYRLVASIHFNRGKVYIRHILTHEEYDRGRWKQ
jgi:mRNA interferase HigB